MQCSNCANPALYVYDPRGVVATYFCSAHLPSFLAQAAKSGQLTTTGHFDEVRSSALAALRPARLAEAPAAEVEEPADAAPEAEPAPVPAPRKKSRRKAPVPKPAEDQTSPQETGEV